MSYRDEHEPLFDRWTDEGPERFVRAEQRFEHFCTTPAVVREWAFSSGCGGPSYEWSDAGEIVVGGEVPQRALPEAVLQWKDLIYDTVEAYPHVPAHYVAGIMALESGGKPNAGSPAGAMGLMQLIHSTAESMAGRDLTTDEIYDPQTNLQLGVKFLSQLWERYKGDPIKMAFAYNAGSARCGSGCIKDYKAKGAPCIQGCAPNRFGLVGDCYASTGVTIDYGGIVAGYANDALLSGAFPTDRPAGSASSDSGEGVPTWMKAAAVLGGVAVVAGGVYLVQQQRGASGALPAGALRRPERVSQGEHAVGREGSAPGALLREEVRVRGQLLTQPRAERLGLGHRPFPDHVRLAQDAVAVGRLRRRLVGVRPEGGHDGLDGARVVGEIRLDRLVHVLGVVAVVVDAVREEGLGLLGAPRRGEPLPDVQQDRRVGGDLPIPEVRTHDRVVHPSSGARGDGREQPLGPRWIGQGEQRQGRVFGDPIGRKEPEGFEVARGEGGVDGQGPHHPLPPHVHAVLVVLLFPSLDGQHDEVAEIVVGGVRVVEYGLHDRPRVLVVVVHRAHIAQVHRAASVKADDRGVDGGQVRKRSPPLSTIARRSRKLGPARRRRQAAGDLARRCA